MAAHQSNERHVVVVEDDKRTNELLCLYLERDGFIVHSAHDGCEGLYQIRQFRPNLVLLDLTLPLLDGFDLCRIIRNESDTPVIILSGKTKEQDILNGFSLGADDYVTKPFSPRQIIVRVHAILRRSGLAALAKANAVIQFDALVVDAVAHEVRLHGEPLDLTPKEFKILETLAREPGRAFRRVELIDRVFGFDYEGLERTIDVHVVNLRRKLNSDNGCINYIHTVFGVGYKFSPENNP